MLRCKDREGGRPGETGGREGGRAGERRRERGRPGERGREGGEREGYKFSLSLPPGDVAATTIRLIPAADVDTTLAPTGLNSHPCQQLG